MSLLAFSALATSTQAAIIYSETFNGVTGTAIAQYDWTAHNSNGTNMTNQTVDPLAIKFNAVFIGSQTGSNQYALISDSASFDTANYENDLEFSTSNLSTGSGTGYRALAKIGSTWYASGFLAAALGTAAETTVLASANNWFAWTDGGAGLETDLTDGFNTATISAVATTLSGVITNSGLLAIDAGGGDTNPRLRTYNFEINATAVPEPSSTSLLGLSGLALMMRRRR